MIVALLFPLMEMGHSLYRPVREMGILKIFPLALAWQGTNTIPFGLRLSVLRLVLLK